MVNSYKPRLYKEISNEFYQQTKASLEKYKRLLIRLQVIVFISFNKKYIRFFFYQPKKSNRNSFMLSEHSKFNNRNLVIYKKNNLTICVNTCWWARFFRLLDGLLMNSWRAGKILLLDKCKYTHHDLPMIIINPRDGEN